MKIIVGAAILKLTVHRTLNPEKSKTNSIYIKFSHWHVPCFVVSPSFADAFPAFFLAVTFVCLSFPSQNRNFNFPAA